MRDVDLRYWYWFYNKKYYKGKLPPAKITFRTVRGEKYWFGLCDTTPSIEIAIHPKIKGFETIVRSTVLHEMAHLKVGDARHGRRFQKEMLRLAKAGAFKEIW